MKEKKFKFSDEEKQRRRDLGLPVTKQLRYMKYIEGGEWQEILVDNYDYEIVDTYMPSGTHSLMITLETGEKQRILLPYFVEMQSPLFVDDMRKMTQGEALSSDEEVKNIQDEYEEEPYKEDVEEPYQSEEEEMGKRKVNGVVVNTKKMVFEHCNIIEAEVGTTGYMGGDSGYGGRTYIKIADQAGTDIKTEAGEDSYGCPYLEIKLGGDAELETIIGALEFIVNELKATANISYDVYKGLGTLELENKASWRQVRYIKHLCKEKNIVLKNTNLITKPIAGSIIGYLLKPKEDGIPENLMEFLEFADEETESR